MFAQVKINPETGTIEWPNGADPDVNVGIGNPLEGLVPQLLGRDPAMATRLLPHPLVSYPVQF